MLLLLLSGNVEPNPGPATTTMCLQTPADFLDRTCIGFIHMNVRSLLPKMDMGKIWANSTNADIMVASETWLSKSIPDSHVNLDGYNLFRVDRRTKGGGVAIYTKNTFQTTVLVSKSVPKQYELLVLKVEFTKGCVMKNSGML
jgi:exonuclease III